MREPHPALAALYVARATLRREQSDNRESTGRRSRAFVVELQIHHAERRYGRGVFKFRRCNVCFLLHAAATIRWDGHGSHLFELWAALGADLVFVEDNNP